MFHVKQRSPEEAGLLPVAPRLLDPPPIVSRETSEQPVTGLPGHPRPATLFPRGPVAGFARLSFLDGLECCERQRGTPLGRVTPRRVEAPSGRDRRLVLSRPMRGASFVAWAAISGTGQRRRDVHAGWVTSVGPRTASGVDDPVVAPRAGALRVVRAVRISCWRAHAQQMFHVEHQSKSGRRSGTPARRGMSSESAPERRSRWSRTPSGSDGAGSGISASRSSPSVGHRLASSVGGSATTNTPVGDRKPVPHSAVTAGGPNDRAITRSARCRQSGSCATSSARPCRATTRSVQPSWRTARWSSRTRRAAASRSSHRESGHRPASARPGTPAPAPRSTAMAGGDSCDAMLEACWRCRSTGPGPTAPSRCPSRQVEHTSSAHGSRVTGWRPPDLQQWRSTGG